jgi:NitT/TauT family transport system permease protein
MARKILLPSAAPALMVGLRIGWSSAFVIVILAELFASQGGIGLLLIQSYNLLQYETMFALVALVCVLALVGNFALGTLERQVRAVAE